MDWRGIKIQDGMGKIVGGDLKMWDDMGLQMGDWIFLDAFQFSRMWFD